MYPIRRLGSTTVANPIEDAVTTMLRAFRANPFPVGVWKMTAKGFNKFVAKVIEISGCTTQQAAQAVTARGYVLSAPPPGFITKPIIPEPVITPPIVAKPPVINLKPAPIRRIVIEPLTTLLPSPLPRQDREPRPIDLPVIIPPSPGMDIDFPKLPATAQSKAPWFWLAMGGLALLFINPKPRSRKTKRRPLSGSSALQRSHAGIGELSGRLLNCQTWEETENPRSGGLRWLCADYAPSAKSIDRCISPGAPTGQMKACTEYKTIKPRSDFYKAKTISRCSRYALICPTPPRVATTVPMPKPEAHPAHYVDVESEVRDYAEAMAKERNLVEETTGKALAREILWRGGIKSYRKGAQKEEYREIPIFMRKKTGLAIDEMADVMGMNERELIELIAKEYPKGKGKKKRKYDWKDFEATARDIVWTNYEQEAERWDMTPEQVRDNYDMVDEAIKAGKPVTETVRKEYEKIRAFFEDDLEGLGQSDLFPGLKRELVLEVEDVATSDDPLFACMQRTGWNLKRIAKLQASIAEKAVPDMFTGKMEKLSASEKELQRAFQKCLDRRKGTAGLGHIPNALLSQGVRKAVTENKKRMTHGDTGLNAFYITPELEIIPWKENIKLKRDVGNASVHSHSAENWNYVKDLTGMKEPPERFSKADIGIFADQVMSGRVDTDALIMGDGRMMVVKCDKDNPKVWALTAEKIRNRVDLPRHWYNMKKYVDLSHPEAAQKKQKEFWNKMGCKWTETRWRQEDEAEPPLYKPTSAEQRKAVDYYGKHIVHTYTKKKGGKGYDLAKSFWIEMPTYLYPLDPIQPELFTEHVAPERSPSGKRRHTMGPRTPAMQPRFFGTNRKGSRI